MESILFLIGGLIGAGNAFKKNFISCWIFLVNLIFSIYISVFISPTAVSFLDISGLSIGYKNAIAVGGSFILADILLYKISERVIENKDSLITLPFFAKFLSAGAGFFSGILIVAILMYCFIQTPFLVKFTSGKDFRGASGKVIMAAVHTVNIFSFQSVSQKAEKDLKSLQILPSDDSQAAQSGEKQIPAADSKNASSEPVKNKQNEQKTPSETKKDSSSQIDDFDF